VACLNVHREGLRLTGWHDMSGNAFGGHVSRTRAARSGGTAITANQNSNRGILLGLCLNFHVRRILSSNRASLRYT
jgi:hypothetical protein